MIEPGSEKTVFQGNSGSTSRPFSMPPFIGLCLPEASPPDEFHEVRAVLGVSVKPLRADISHQGAELFRGRGEPEWITPFHALQALHR